MAAAGQDATQRVSRRQQQQQQQQLVQEGLRERLCTLQDRSQACCATAGEIQLQPMCRTEQAGQLLPMLQ